MPNDKDGERPSRKGELRRRWRSLLEDGAFRGVGSEGRLVALYVFQVADWASCEAVFSVKRAADAVSVHKNTIHRGVVQLVKAGVLEVVGKGSSGRPSKYRVCRRPHIVDDSSTTGEPPRPRSVGASSTTGGRVDHVAWARRLQAVGASSTSSGRDTVLPSGSPVRTSENPSEATPASGLGPDAARHESDDSGRESAQ
jgi:hypothetical protein